MYEQLKNLRDRLATRLELGDLTQEEYWKATYDISLEEGLIEGNNPREDQDFSIMIGGRLQPKLPAHEIRGLNNVYVALVGKNLYTYTTNDLQNLKDLIESTRSYLQEKVGDRVISEREFGSMVSKYLRQDSPLRQLLTDKSKERGIVIYIKATLEKEFNIEDPDSKIGRFDTAGIEDAINRL